MFSIFRSFDFAFCTSSQDLFFRSKYEVLVQFEGVLVFDSQFSVFFCWGIFGVCMCMYVCGYVCIQWRANWKTVLLILLLPPVENKTNLYIKKNKTKKNSHKNPATSNKILVIDLMATVTVKAGIIQ